MALDDGIVDDTSDEDGSEGEEENEDEDEEEDIVVTNSGEKRQHRAMKGDSVVSRMLERERFRQIWEARVSDMRTIRIRSTAQSS